MPADSELGPMLREMAGGSVTGTWEITLRALAYLVEQASPTSTAEVVANLIEADPHDFSKRPCPTCRSISAILDRRFGCVAKAHAG